MTEQVTATCKGIAYRQDALQRAATKAFTLHTRPGAQYELDGVVRVRVARVSPLTVRVSGRWVYVLSQDDEQWLAQQIAGDSPRQATAYLLHTGYITRATVPGPLPKDPGYIRFAILVGL